MRVQRYSMIERVETGGAVSWFCNTCAHDWKDAPPRARFRSLEDVVARTGVNREELATLAGIGALNAFGHHRREALWAHRAGGEAGGGAVRRCEDEGLGTRDSGRNGVFSCER